jgi:hypothetical protein
MVRETSQFMGEAHVHGFCNRLKRSIVVVDVREPAVVLSKYQPGSDMQRQLSMLEALQLRNQERHEKEGERQRQLTHPKDKEATAEEKVRLLYEEGYWVTLEQWALVSRAKLCSLAMMGYIQ